MIRVGKQTLILGVVLLSSLSAWAGPPPLTPVELDEQAALIVDARVVGVEVLGETEVPGEFHTVHLEASLEILALHKGQEIDDLRIQFDVELVNTAQEMCAWAEPPHWEGEVSKLWLKPRNNGTHAMIYWNAQEEAAESDPQPLTTEEMLGTSPVSTLAQGGGCSVASTGGPAGLGLLVLGGLLLLGFRGRQTNE